MIAAVGKFGQIGHGSSLPWYNPDDLKLFKKLTLGAVCIFGQRTLNLLPPLAGRFIEPYAGRHATPADRILMIKSKYPDWDVWICGGTKTYRDFAPYVDGLRVISYIDYDGPADRYFPFDAYGIDP